MLIRWQVRQPRVRHEEGGARGRLAQEGRNVVLLVPPESHHGVEALEFSGKLPVDPMACSHAMCDQAHAVFAMTDPLIDPCCHAQE